MNYKKAALVIFILAGIIIIFEVARSTPKVEVIKRVTLSNKAMMNNNIIIHHSNGNKINVLQGTDTLYIK